ncbi:hypothetical protein HY490_05715 [Candidatus Woesearchaeota archaeon]|nr:hypothetical protein [Candidatus Woesearchaeota archaeon]
MTLYRCHQCGHKSSKTGTCPSCNISLHKKCGVCGLEIEFCTCTAFIPQTKGHKPR